MHQDTCQRRATIDREKKLWDMTISACISARRACWGVALLVYGSMLLRLPGLRALAVLAPLIVVGRMAWSATVSTLNAAAQLAFQPAVRARTLSICLCVMAAGYTAGRLVWGRLADRAGVQVALACAGACMIIHAISLLKGNEESAI